MTRHLNVEEVHSDLIGGGLGLNCVIDGKSNKPFSSQFMFCSCVASCFFGVSVSKCHESVNPATASDKMGKEVILLKCFNCRTLEILAILLGGCMGAVLIEFRRSVCYRFVSLFFFLF